MRLHAVSTALRVSNVSLTRGEQMPETVSRADFIERVLREFLPQNIRITRIATEHISFLPTFEFRFTNPETRHKDYSTLIDVLWYLGTDKYDYSRGIVRAEV